jgi:hypothetical protein
MSRADEDLPAPKAVTLPADRFGKLHVRCPERTTRRASSITRHYTNRPSCVKRLEGRPMAERGVRLPEEMPQTGVPEEFGARKRGNSVSQRSRDA